MPVRTPISLLLLAFITFACHEKQKPAPAPAETIVSDSMTQATPELVNNGYVSVDISPMDMSYFPVDYPKLKMANSTIPPPVARVIYSRPHLQKRHLFHDLLKFGEPWRLGANESTEIDFYRAVTIQDKKIIPGRYVIYCIPHPETWTLVLNSNIDSWGLHQDSTKDIQHFNVPVTSNNTNQDYFTMLFEKTNTGANLMIAWDSTVAKLPIVFK